MPLAYTRVITDRDRLCQKLGNGTLAGLVPASPCCALKMEIAAQGREGKFYSGVRFAYLAP